MWLSSVGVGPLVVVLVSSLCIRFGSYNVLRVPLLVLLASFVALDLVAYALVRAAVTLVESVWVQPYKRRDRGMRRSTYSQWVAVGLELDQLERLDVWKADPESRAYNWRQVVAVTKKLREARERATGAPPPHARAPWAELQLQLLPTLVKNYAGVLSWELYSKTHVGTKRTVEEFVDEVCRCLAALREHGATSELAATELAPFWRQAQISFGNSALLLSGGAMMGIYHYGVVKALLEGDALPRVISGTSAGAVVAAFLATRTDAEVRAELTTLDGLFREQGSHGPLHGSLWWKARKLLRDGVLYSVPDFKSHLEFFCQGLTFREAFLRSGRVVTITCTPHKRLAGSSPPLMLNHITAPNVTIASAVCASSCVPGLIEPITLEEKLPDGSLAPCQHQTLLAVDSGTGAEGAAESIRMRDGSFETDIPKWAIAQMFNVHFTLVSQVNPHILPFTYGAEGSYGMPNLWRRGRGGWRGGFLLSTLETLLKEDMLKWLRVMRSQRLGPVLLGVDWSTVFLQDNQGDITLSPNVPFTDYVNVISNASSRGRIERMVAEGEQITWRAMSMVQNRLRVQRLLDDAVEDPLLASRQQSLAHSREPPGNCDKPTSSVGLGAAAAARVWPWS